MKRNSVVIIGSGLSGLLCGYILSKEGFPVTILEKQIVPGGCLQNFSRNGVTFDTGMHYVGGLGEGQNLSRYLKYFNLLPEIPTVELDPEGFDIISLPTGDYPWSSGTDRFKDVLSSHFPGERDNLHRFVQSLTNICQEFPLYNLSLPGNDTAGNRYHSRSAWDFICSITHHPILRHVLVGNHFLYDGNKDSTPLSQYALVVHSFLQGAYYFSDGSQQIVDRLIQEIKKNGGSIFTGHEVVSIEHRQKETFLIKTNHTEYPSELVISSIHPAALLNIMGKNSFPPSFSKRICQAKNSRGCFSLYMKLSPSVYPYMTRNYYCFESMDVWNDKSDHFFMIHTPVFHDSPQFAKTAILLALMDYKEVEKWKDTTTGNRSSDYKDFKERTVQKNLGKLAEKFPELHRSIRYYDTSTPLTFRDYTGTPEGSIYGLKHDYHSPAVSTVLPRTKIPGLYFTGQNTNLHGMLGVTISAVKTCGEVLGLDYLMKKIRSVTE